jgi:general secretion pathway protein H
MDLARTVGSGAPCRTERAGRSVGFTLIELLVVLVILGVLVGAVSLSFADLGARRLVREAEQLRALIAYACEQAELTGRTMGLAFRDAGYRFSRFERAAWLPIGSDELRPRAWLTGTVAELSRDGRAVEIAAEYPETPQLACFASGELSPFRLELHRADVRQRVRLDGDGDGRLTLITHAP